MFFIFLFMDEFSLSGLAHEILEITLFILFILHNILNYRFFTSLFKGKYSLNRIIRTTINILLLASMIITIISSFMILMVKQLFLFLLIMVLLVKQVAYLH